MPTTVRAIDQPRDDSPATPTRADHARVQAWPERLAAYILSQLDRPHAWGTHDCARFAAGAYEAITEHALQLPHWGTEDEARAALERLGGIVTAVDSILPRLPAPAHAQRGDIALITLGDLPSWLAVVDVGGAWAPSSTGLSRVGMRHASHAWAVGGRHAQR